MNGDTVTLVYVNLKSGVPWRFGPAWPGQRCGARTRRGTACQRPAKLPVGRCRLHGGASAGPRTKEGLARLTAARTTHGKYTKKKRGIAKHQAEIGRRVRGQLKRIEREIENAGLMPTDD